MDVPMYASRKVWCLQLEAVCIHPKVHVRGLFHPTCKSHVLHQLADNVGTCLCVAHNWAGFFVFLPHPPLA